MAPLFGTLTKNTTVIKVERVPRRAARFVKSWYSRYSSVSDMLAVLGGGGSLFLKGDMRLDLLDQIFLTISMHPFHIIP